jgi:hypothetical protein
MFRFWDAVIAPLLEELAPRTLVEIGSFAGDNTAKLLRFARAEGAVLHAIDPLPRFPAAEWAAGSEGHMVFHQALSLEALPRIPASDVALIDGDHNWYTVHHELLALEARARAEGVPFPVCVFHDIAWPYDRRDLYYDPRNLPAEGLLPMKTGGLHPDHPGLLEEDGMSLGLHHAIRYGGPRNGVLTGIEDFLARAGFLHDFIQVPGFFGLGVLIPEARRKAGGHQDRLREHLGDLLLAGGLLQALERERLEHFIEAQEAQRRNKNLLKRAQRKVRNLLHGRGRR